MEPKPTPNGKAQEQGFVGKPRHDICFLCKWGPPNLVAPLYPTTRECVKALPERFVCADCCKDKCKYGKTGICEIKGREEIALSTDSGDVPKPRPIRSKFSRTR